jgi:hypothetical protein
VDSLKSKVRRPLCRRSAYAKRAMMPRTITADTFNRWWAALDQRVRQEPDISRSERSPAGVRLNAKAALQELESCTETQHQLFHDGLDPNVQYIRGVVASGDTVVLDKSDQRGDDSIEDLINNIVALTGIEPEYVDEPVPSNDVEPMVERLREAREARDE